MLSYKTNWKNEVTEQEIVDAIECMALRFCGAFAWRVKQCSTVVTFASVVCHPFLLFLSSFVLE